MRATHIRYIEKSSPHSSGSAALVSLGSLAAVTVTHLTNCGLCQLRVAVGRRWRRRVWPGEEKRTPELGDMRKE